MLSSVIAMTVTVSAIAATITISVTAATVTLSVIAATTTHPDSRCEWNCASTLGLMTKYFHSSIHRAYFILFLICEFVYSICAIFKFYGNG